MLPTPKELPLQIKEQISLGCHQLSISHHCHPGNHKAVGAIIRTSVLAPQNVHPPVLMSTLTVRSLEKSIHSKMFQEMQNALYFAQNCIYVGAGKEMGENVLVDLVVFTKLEVIKK